MIKMKDYLKELWLSTPLSRKLMIYTAVVILVMGLSAAFNIRLMDYALGNFGDILKDNSRCQELQDAFQTETAAFADYAKERNRDNRRVFQESVVSMKRCLGLLPVSYRAVGEERFARTWNIKNAYEAYAGVRDEVLDLDPEDALFVPQLYEVYSRQDYIRTYIQMLLQATMADGDQRYQESTVLYERAPYLIILVSLLLVVAALSVNRFVARAWTVPIQKLVGSTKKIAVNDFGGEDIVVENKDEIGDLVQAFNKMKYATGGYIASMMENYEMSERLHQEELERIQAEKRLEDTRLELLKSQINPHFLFNTLHTIACMAKLEDAPSTEHMITSMSNLFRYNLKTTEQIVPLSQELKVVEDYIYIQKMRFGSRIGYRAEVQVDPDEQNVPAFTLQPLVENACVHGISKKEEGGMIRLSCRKEDGVLIIAVEDTGVGIPEAYLTELRGELKSSVTSRIGIGLGNIYRRIHALYPEGGMELMSSEGSGTMVLLRIPQKGAVDDSNTDCG